jgi:hypothetical protein
MLRRVALVITDVSEELSSSFIRMTRIRELGTTLAVTSKRRTLRRNTKNTFPLSIQNLRRLDRILGWSLIAIAVAQSTGLFFTLCAMADVVSTCPTVVFLCWTRFGLGFLFMLTPYRRAKCCVRTEPSGSLYYVSTPMNLWWRVARTRKSHHIFSALRPITSVSLKLSFSSNVHPHRGQFLTSCKGSISAETKASKPESTFV